MLLTGLFFIHIVGCAFPVRTVHLFVGAGFIVVLGPDPWVLRTRGCVPQGTCGHTDPNVASWRLVTYTYIYLLVL